MRILHTSDWHVGRTFHGYSTLEATRTVLAELPRIVRSHDVDVVVVAGDVYDLANPSADAVAVLRDALTDLLATGVQVVMTSGNHDSATRLGFAGAFSTPSGLHLRTDPARVTDPIAFADAHGPVDVYVLPFLQPDLLRRLPWVPDAAQTQNDVVTAAMSHVRAAADERRADGHRAVVVAHTFVAGAHAETSDAERAITREPRVAGGVDVVPVGAFDGVDYAALGHIHGRTVLARHVRYPGAPLHTSFSEAGKPRGAWLAELDADGLADVTWVDLPVPRPLRQISGTFDHLLTDPGLAEYADHYVRAVYTDATREVDPMRRLRERFPWCAEVAWEPTQQQEPNSTTYAERVKGRTDTEVVSAFLADVRAGEGPSPHETALVEAVIAEHTSEQAR